MIANMICSFFGTVGFSVLFNVPKRFYGGCGFTGMVGWICYLLVINSSTATIATFAGSLLVVLLARILAVWKKCPITIFLVPGIFPLIPGVSVYNTAYYLVTEDLSLAAASGMEAIKIAFAIVLGIVLVFSIPRQVFQVSHWKKSKQQEGDA